MASSGILYVVATPIGNLKDITLRAIDVFREVDFVVAESSLRALKLLNHLAINKSIVSINAYNEARKAAGIVDQIRKGKSCALITSAGTPCISDPGNHIVKKCYDEGVEVRSIPGPSAVIGALSISGLFADRFVFLGFLPQKRGKQKKILRDFVELPYALVLYESPRRVRETLENLRETLGDRQVVLFKEMTKVHEEVFRGTMGDVIEDLPDDDLKGEYVVVVAAKEKEAADPIDVDYC